MENTIKRVLTSLPVVAFILTMTLTIGIIHFLIITVLSLKLRREWEFLHSNSEMLTALEARIWSTNEKGTITTTLSMDSEKIVDEIKLECKPKYASKVIEICKRDPYIRSLGVKVVEIDVK